VLYKSTRSVSYAEDAMVANLRLSVRLKRIVNMHSSIIEFHQLQICKDSWIGLWRGPSLEYCI
jgi:hypothetical protein